MLFGGENFFAQQVFPCFPIKFYVVLKSSSRDSSLLIDRNTESPSRLGMDSFLLHQLKSPAKAVQNLETILKSSCQAPDTVEPREIKCLSDSEDNENSRAAIRRNDVRYFAD
jgi:hypothetical protein